MHIRWLREAKLPLIKKKVIKRALSFRANGFLPFQETHPHPLLMPLLEDPKMELKTFLLPLRLGLLTTEVNIFSLKVFPPSLQSEVVFLKGKKIAVEAAKKLNN